jgi:hypothetical protein
MMGENTDNDADDDGFMSMMMTVARHGRAWPGHPRLFSGKGVDARPKAGHDDV